MANRYVSSRTNYFRVKDDDAFRSAMKEYEVEVWKKGGSPTLFALGSRTEDGGWPTCDDDLEAEIDFPIIVSEYLADGEVAVFQTVGAEKLRYLCGFATAVINTGEYVDVDIDDIYELAKKKFGVPSITLAQY